MERRARKRGALQNTLVFSEKVHPLSHEIDKPIFSAIMMPALIQDFLPKQAPVKRHLLGGRPSQSRGDTVELLINLPVATAMRQAIAFVIIMIAFGIFMPEVLALSVFLLTLFTKATALLNALPASPAMIGQTAGH